MHKDAYYKIGNASIITINLASFSLNIHLFPHFRIISRIHTLNKRYRSIEDIQDVSLYPIYSYSGFLHPRYDFAHARHG